VVELIFWVGGFEVLTLMGLDIGMDFFDRWVSRFEMVVGILAARVAANSCCKRVVHYIATTGIGVD
jgi:hypothetical protein